jgi:hypothetical protein
MPKPPCLAIEIAILASVTVSMAEEISGTLIEMFLETWVWVLTPDGITSDGPGSSRTSS